MGFVLWGSELSPFALKVESLLRFAGVGFRWLPRDGSPREARRFALRRSRVVSGRRPLTWPEKSELDEFPQVPFLFGPAGEDLYDSSAIGAWLDREAQRTRTGCSALVPREDAALGFAVKLVDEALDEVGLYLVHHHRWVVAARDNDAGRRLARELRPLLGPAARLLERRFPARQVRRLPYLLSVAPAESAEWNDLPRRLRPPARPGFPPTHALLELGLRELLGAVEPLLARQPFLFGERFTLADGSLYGQLGMNLSDPSACARIRHLAPATHRWLERLRQGDFAGHRDAAQPTLGAEHAALLEWIAALFLPLMRQNAAAYNRHRRAGETLFNEAAFDSGRALYDGELLERPFRSVAKTFQVRVWRELRQDWAALGASERRRLAGGLAAPAGFEDLERED